MEFEGAKIAAKVRALRLVCTPESFAPWQAAVARKLARKIRPLHAVVEEVTKKKDAVSR